MIDLNTSRRDMYLKCTYWSKDEDENYVDNSEIVYEKIPSGFFSAKEINSYQISNQVIDVAFMTEQQNINIITYDKISNLKINDIVKISGNDTIYRVDDIQIIPNKKQRFFNKSNFSKTHYITLKA